MAEALAAAVERLRARAETAPPEAADEQQPNATELAAEDAGAGLGPAADTAAGERLPEPLTAPGPAVPRAPLPPATEPAETTAEAPEQEPEPAAAEPAAAAPAPKPHKHTMSLLGRIRYRRKQRRDG
jgi:hypothetical protein